MPHLEIRGKTVYVADFNPEGRETVIMVHGLFANHTFFYLCGAQELASRYRVILYDLRGHGSSEPRPDGLGVFTVARDLIDLMNAMRLERAHLVGYSFGAAVALGAALGAPDRCGKLALIEPFGLSGVRRPAGGADSWTGPADWFAAMAVQYCAAGVSGPSGGGAAALEAQARRLAADPLTASSLYNDREFFERAPLDRVGQPTLVLSGSQSQYAHDAEVVANRVPGAIVGVASGDHSLPVADGAWVRDRLIEFLSGPDAATTAILPTDALSQAVPELAPELVAELVPESLPEAAAQPVQEAIAALAPALSAEPAAWEEEAPGEQLAGLAAAPARTEGLSLSVRGLTKSYRGVRAVRGIDFEVPEGAFFAFVGSNGAGKSTTINCLTTLLRPDSGKIEVAGHRLGAEDNAIRRSIGVVFQSPLLDPFLTVREALTLRGSLNSMNRRDVRDRIAELANLLSLEDFLDRRYGVLSGGQKRRADIARALLHSPAILFLDEPTAGLDPHSRTQVWQAIESVRRSRYMTTFLTTHYMEETEQADTVCVIAHGRIVESGSPAALRARYSESALTVRLTDPDKARERLARAGLGLPAGLAPGQPVGLRTRSTAEAKAVLAWIWDEVDDFEFQHGSMDEVFVKLTKDVGEAEPETGSKGGARRRAGRKERKRARTGEAGA
ncbi:MAG: alpha/beta fold hydrolase [Bifidobacteriaceae bacterium]|jgi:multidrug/hemolysin transport system ATP-binding protein|nr:alpha/beta fold hydrolase [Bifidobacteriaceae bacterium]